MWKQFYLFLFRSKCDDELSFTTTSSFVIENPPWTNNALKKYKFTFLKQLNWCIFIFLTTQHFHFTTRISSTLINLIFSSLIWRSSTTNTYEFCCTAKTIQSIKFTGFFKCSLEHFWFRWRRSTTMGLPRSF